MLMPSTNHQQQQIVVQQMQNTVGSMEGSRPQSAIKKKSNGISPNSKAAKQLHLMNSVAVQRATNNAKQAQSGKPYQN
jgi:hypothetical protein